MVQRRLCGGVAGWDEGAVEQRVSGEAGGVDDVNWLDGFRLALRRGHRGASTDLEREFGEYCEFGESLLVQEKLRAQGSGLFAWYRRSRSSGENLSGSIDGIPTGLRHNPETITKPRLPATEGGRILVILPATKRRERTCFALPIE